MPGNENSDSTEQPNEFFYYDEGLSSKIGEVLKHVGFSLEIGGKGRPDEDIIPEMGLKHQTWITKDDRSRVEHEDIILEAGISIVFVRGLSHEGRKRSSLVKNTINLKQLLFLLVSKLDDIQAELSSSTKARYFILYLRSRKAELSKHSTLREVWQQLFGSV